MAPNLPRCDWCCRPTANPVPLTIQGNTGTYCPACLPKLRPGARAIALSTYLHPQP